MKWLILLGGTDMSAMKTQSSKTIIVGVFTMLSCLLAVGVEDALSIAPPVAAALVRLGNFALSLVTALVLGQPASEAAAGQICLIIIKSTFMPDITIRLVS